MTSGEFTTSVCDVCKRNVTHILPENARHLDCEPRYAIDRYQMAVKRYGVASREADRLLPAYQAAKARS
jgi:hypothetical protein